MLKRNSWLALAMVASLCLAAAHLRAQDAKPAAQAKPDAEGFISLFDGKTLDGWDGNTDLWSVKDGCIVGQTSAGAPLKSNTFLIWKGGEPGDFELHVTWKMTNHNSGIQYRSKHFDAKAGDPNKWILGGYQADMDEKNAFTGICYEERGRAVFVGRGEKITVDEAGKKTVESKADSKEIAKVIKAGDWNEYVIICKGPHCIQKLNGVTTAEFTDNQKDKAMSKGLIGFQLHAGPPMQMFFKDIKIKMLD
ncbi:MAG: DUF1080 domain-containing protein [Candidatus Sumerlaeota bacterium]|nr:DUF1080 domain-containing protein [Candidatus Sumerlaeota bacterium]